MKGHAEANLVSTRRASNLSTTKLSTLSSTASAGGIYPESRQMAEQHRDGLAGALWAVPEIRNMTRNPVVLTALAVVHWNEKRIPGQRADL